MHNGFRTRSWKCRDNLFHAPRGRAKRRSEWVTGWAGEFWDTNGQFNKHANVHWREWQLLVKAVSQGWDEETMRRCSCLEGNVLSRDHFVSLACALYHRDPDSATKVLTILSWKMVSNQLKYHINTFLYIKHCLWTHHVLVLFCGGEYCPIHRDQH